MTASRFFFLCLFVWMALLTRLRSQDGHTPNKPALLAEYRQADAYYQKALQLNFSAAYSEEAEKKLNQQALERFRRLNQQLSGRQPYDSLLFFTTFKSGELQHYFERTAAALEDYREAIRIHSRVPRLEDSLLFKPYLFSGIIYYGQNLMDTALRYFQQAENIQAKYAQKLEENERLYNLLGALLYETGNYRQAKNYLGKAAAVLPPSNPYYKDLYVLYRINQAATLIKLEAYDSAYALYQELLPMGIRESEIYNNMGLIHHYRGEGEQAIRFLKKVRHNNALDIGLYNDLGNAYLLLKQYDSARAYLQKAVAENGRYFGGRRNSQHGLTLKYTGDLEAALQQPLRALALYQQAIREFYPAYTDTALHANPEKYSGLFAYLHLFHTLAAKADAQRMLYRQTNQTDWAKRELDTYRSAFRLVDYVERSYDSDEARLFLHKTRALIHDKPIDIALALYRETGDAGYKEAAFQFDQENKAAVLQFSQQLLHLLPTNDSLWQKERALKAAITRMSLQAGRLNSPAALDSVNSRIRDHEILLGKLQDRKRAQHPAAFGQPPSARDLQKNLLDGATAVLSYHLAPNALTIFQITRNDFTVRQLPITSGFRDTLLRFTAGLRTEGEAFPGHLARQLHRSLLGPGASEQIKRLIIIPEAELAYLPFETLQNGSGQYLAAHCAVQYQYAAALLKKEKGDFRNSAVLALAPFAGAGYRPAGFTRLPYSGQEISRLPGQAVTGTGATKALFLKHINRYDIVHLATHAAVNTDRQGFSYIAFAPFGQKSEEDFLLYEQEVYNLPMRKTRLVVLSACETGAGQLVRGEGVMSLSRAFAYSGCANVITSLWKADDEATAYLMQQFHAGLQQGLQPDAALQSAKAAYLADTKVHPRKKHPAYWAHFIFVGNYAPRETGLPGWVPWGILLLLLFGGIGAVYRFQQARRRRKGIIR